ncbi:50S ribosomal protein L35 [Patescibacteria group bacterium]|nr:50S ribosomal protein L35 [Patescibacteria group bacterium]
MPKLKTHKSVSKRITVTKTGKVIKRKNGQGHFNSRESSRTTVSKRRDLQVAPVYAANMKTMLPNA